MKIKPVSFRSECGLYEIDLSLATNTWDVFFYCYGPQEKPLYLYGFPTLSGASNVVTAHAKACNTKPFPKKKAKQ